MSAWRPCAEAPEIADQITKARNDESTKDVADCAMLINEQATRPGSEADTKGVAKHYGKPMTADDVVVTAPKKGNGPSKVALKVGDETIPCQGPGHGG